eukprot:294404-Prorocentrum_minimum.AAC.1
MKRRGDGGAHLCRRRQGRKLRFERFRHRHLAHHRGPCRVVALEFGYQRPRCPRRVGRKRVPAGGGR